MKTKILNLKLATAPDNLKRSGYVLLVCIDEQKRIGLGAKYKWYPDGIYRLPGGGIESGERPEESAVREIQEELNLHVSESDLIPLLEVVVDADTAEGKFKQSFFCYAVKADSKSVTAGDDIDGINFMTKKEYAELNNQLQKMDVNLKNSHWNIERWRDYGTLFSAIHKIVGEELSANGLW